MIRLYNTLGRQLEEFRPLSGKKVGLYTCGPTVYGTAHLGNLRTYIFADVLRRTLEFNGLAVKHVMNITDVGHLTGDGDMGQDKIEASAKKEKKSAYDIAAGHTREFFDDLEQLNVETPTVVLKATETIPWQIDLVKKLESKGMTYRTSDGIYFDTAKFPRYGQLSGQQASGKKAGARVEVNAEKRHPADFALWKFSQPEDQRQMEWPSPWGVGFPGWHLECSAMSMKELGQQFDIHTGGVDHIAVHHENEIAQSEAATGEHPFVRFWLHGEFLILPVKRMGKSEGNAVTLPDVIGRGINPLAFRYLCLQTHYRQKLNFSWESLTAAARGLNGLWATIDNAEPEAKKGSAIGCAEFEQKFSDAVSDDLNTSEALAVMSELIQSDYPWSAKRQSLSIFDRVLGLDLNEQSAKRNITPAGPEIDTLLEDYETARREKRFHDSDEIRKNFLSMGITVEDTPSGSRLRKK